MFPDAGTAVYNPAVFFDLVRFYIAQVFSARNDTKVASPVVELVAIYVVYNKMTWYYDALRLQDESMQ